MNKTAYEFSEQHLEVSPLHQKQPKLMQRARHHENFEKHEKRHLELISIFKRNIIDSVCTVQNIKGSQS
jgi:hypothetical protein